MFGDVTSSSVAEDFGLLPDDVTAPAGPFMRPSEQDLVITAAVTRRGAFPGDGLDQMRTALLDSVAEYTIGDQVWSNDLLCAIEAVAGTRVTTFTVQHDSADVSGVAQPLDTLWTLAVGDIDHHDHVGGPNGSTSIERGSRKLRHPRGRDGRNALPRAPSAPPSSSRPR